MEVVVSIIIIHYGPDDYLLRSLKSIKSTNFSKKELIIIDNNEAIDSNIRKIEDIIESFKYVYVRNCKNMGFASGCNQGINLSTGRYIFILNNDIEIDKNCIDVLVDFAERHTDIAILQPKMLDFTHRNTFHSSAGGGYIDVFGYPFARGRILDTAEEDLGQYDDVVDIFWAGGAALFARKSILEEAGLFDGDFFLYMEEIDLAWRVQLLGHRLIYVPAAKIYHLGCPSLGRENFLRMYFDHRNSLLMLIKNLSPWNLLLLLPLRCGLELGTVIGSLCCLRFTRGWAIFRAFGYILRHLPGILHKRRIVQDRRKVKDKIVFSNAYFGSVALNYYLRRVRTVKDLPRFQVTRYISNWREER
jgi:GT2 family glycosyltransferase